MEEELKKLMIELKERRENLETSKRMFADQNKEFLTKVGSHQEEMREYQNGTIGVEKNIKKLALEIHSKQEKVDGKQVGMDVGYGVKVKMFKTMGYGPDDAFEWAVEHKMALQLNKTAFEKIAKADDSIKFVTKDEEPRAEIPTNIVVGENDRESTA